ncbi:MAG: hypothetical protein II956_09875 [Bacteroidales bacterium]|nr:hypothetical protein [Bacteroidales bacterium]
MILRGARQVGKSTLVRKEVFSVDNIQDVWRGRIAEHIVAQELIAHNSKVSAKRNFWVSPKSGATSEIDFNDLQIPSDKKFKLINIPFYYVGILERILKNFL